MDIVLYSTHCPKCNVLQKKLDAAQITYAECNDIDKMLALDILQAPVLCVDGVMMDFSEAVQWIHQQEELT